MDARSQDARAFSAIDPAYRRVEWRRHTSLFRRRFRLFLISTVGGVLVSVAVILVLPARYTATAEVVIDPHRQPSLDLRAEPSNTPLDASTVDTEVELLKSRILAAKVAEAFGLDHDPEFAPKPRLFPAAPVHSQSEVAQRREAIREGLERRLKVARVGFTSVVDISVTSASPDKAASLANAFTALYLQQQLEAKSAASRRTSDLLNSRVEALGAEVAGAERDVERYKAAHGLMTLAGSQGATSTEQEISNFDTQLVAAQGQKADAEARLAAAVTETSGGRAGDDLGEVLNSPVVQDLRKKRNEITELLNRYGPRHPERLKAEHQRAELDAQIGQEIGRVVSNLRVQVQVARGHSVAIAAALGKAKAELAKNNNASVDLKQLEQNLDAVKTLYQAYLDRFKQTLAQDGMAQADARWVSPAKAPLSPASPNRLLLLAIAATVSALSALLAVWIAEAREDGLYDAEDVEARLGVQGLGIVPSIGKSRSEEASPADLVLSRPLSGFAEAFRVLKAELLLRRASGPIRTIAITSALPGEGKTTTSLCLGRMMATSGAATLLVDCDLRRRTMSRLLASKPQAGLLDVLAGRADLDDALILDGASGLMLLPLGDEELVQDDIFATPAMGELLETLRRRFRTVLLDTAPVLMVADTTLLASRTDATLFLVRWGKTQAGTAANAVRRLEGAGAYVAGAVLTQVDLKRTDHRAYPYAADYYPFYREEKADRLDVIFKAGWRRLARRT